MSPPPRNEDTPTDIVSARAVAKARRQAMNSLEDYRVVAEKHYWAIAGTVVGLVISNVTLWIYVLIRLPR